MKHFTQAQVNAVVGHLSKVAEGIMKVSKHHDPMLVLYAEDDVRVVSMAPIMASAEKKFAAGDVAGGYAVKDEMAAQMKMAADEYKAIGAVTIIEAWTGSVKPDEIRFVGGDEPGMGGIRGPLARFDPNRGEALVFSYEFRMEDGSKLSKIILREIIRKDGEVTLGAPVASPGGGDGRFRSLIK
jgi:hypothetical protein